MTIMNIWLSIPFPKKKDNLRLKTQINGLSSDILLYYIIFYMNTIIYIYIYNY